MIKLLVQKYSAFTLVEILLISAIFLILIAGAFTLLSNRTFEADIDAKASEIAGLINKAQNYSRSGYLGDVWGIKVLIDDQYCSLGDSCVILFKGNSYNDRDSAYDQQVNFGERNSGVFLSADQDQEFYFSFGSGWLVSEAEENIALESNFGLKKSVRVMVSGLAYVFIPGICGDGKVSGDEVCDWKLNTGGWPAGSCGDSLVQSGNFCNSTCDDIITMDEVCDYAYSASHECDDSFHYWYDSIDQPDYYCREDCLEEDDRCMNMEGL